MQVGDGEILWGAEALSVVDSTSRAPLSMGVAEVDRIVQWREVDDSVTKW